MSLELVPLCTAEVRLAAPILIPHTPAGTRVIGEVTDMTVTGRINAKLKGAAAADWLTIGKDQTLGSIDVRVTLETDDGVVIFASYLGRLDMAQSPAVVYAAPLFDTGHENYRWLSRIQAVAKGVFEPDMSGLTYEMYELR